MISLLEDQSQKWKIRNRSVLEEQGVKLALGHPGFGESSHLAGFLTHRLYRYPSALVITL